MRRTRAVAVAALGLLLGAAAGCGEKSKYVPVSGVVKLNGQPYPNAVVVFQPVGGKDNPNPEVLRELNIREAIRSGLTAEAAVQRVRDDNRTRMNQISDPYLRERLLDLEDLANRLLQHVAGKAPVGRVVY